MLQSGFDVLKQHRRVREKEVAKKTNETVSRVNSVMRM